MKLIWNERKQHLDNVAKIPTFTGSQNLIANIYFFDEKYSLNVMNVSFGCMFSLKAEEESKSEKPTLEKLATSNLLYNINDPKKGGSTV